MYDVHLSPKARKFYARADQPLARKLARCFVQLEKEPRQHANVKMLTGNLAGRYRYRVGDYRVVYRIDDAEQTVFVQTIAHRSDAYR